MRSIIPFEDNPVLRETAREIPVGDITSPQIRELISDMQKLLAVEHYGVALAAPQVGEALRLFIVSGRALSEREDDGERITEDDDVVIPSQPDQIYINPTIVKTSQAKKRKHEGCLSVRGKWGMVPRAEKVSVRAYDEHGRVFTRGASGFLAHIFQHEIDHLNGILYTDKAVELYDDEESDEE